MSFRGGRGGRNFGGGPGAGYSMETDITLAELTFKNWDQASRDDLVGFIRRKTGVELRNIWVAPNKILHGFVLPQEADQVAKFSGVKFAGKSLSIFIKNNPQQSSGGGGNQSIEALRNVLKSRYDPNIKMLNLSAIKQDNMLTSLGSFTPSKMFQALMKIAKDEAKLQVDTVDLSNNDIQDIATVSSLALTYPHLKNLSLANNSINRIQSLENWRHKFPYLRELILTGNKITTEPTYKDDIMKLFSRLVMLDGIVIRDESQIAVMRLPNPMKQSFFENQDIQQAANGFLNSYFQLYDSDRSQLLQLYDDMSTLSIAVDATSPRVLNGVPPSWSAYIPMSRNLHKITTFNSRQSRLYIGTQVIGNTFRKIPASRHDFAPEKFAIDVWKTSNVRQANDNGVVISLHGEFTEPQSNNQLRSFDRTFIVLVGPNGQMIVASDMITLRPWSGIDAWKEGTSKEQQQQQQPTQPASGAPQEGAPPPPELNGLTPDQIMIVQNLMQATKLNAQFARMCAEQAQFNAQQSMVLFEQSKGSLPPNAFQQ